MKKKVVTIIITLCSFILTFIILHSTPHTSLRTHIFMTGHPIVSFNTSIKDDELHNKLNQQDNVSDEFVKFYTLTSPPLDKATESKLSNYKITKIGFLFFARYFGEA